MSDLEIKITLGNYIIELKGSSDDVINQFAELKKDGLGQIVSQFVPKVFDNKSNEPENNKGNNPLLSSETTSFPNKELSLMSIVYKNLPKSETEWVVIYGYFLEKEGKDNFTRNDLIQKYVESKRKTGARMKNFAASIKVAVKNEWFNLLNDEEMHMTETGRSFAVEILTRQGPATRNVKKKTVIKPKNLLEGQNESNH